MAESRKTRSWRSFAVLQERTKPKDRVRVDSSPQDGKPAGDHEAILSLTPREARHLATDLLRAADVVDRETGR